MSCFCYQTDFVKPSFEKYFIFKKFKRQLSRILSTALGNHIEGGKTEFSKRKESYTYTCCCNQSITMVIIIMDKRRNGREGRGRDKVVVIAAAVNVT